MNKLIAMKKMLGLVKILIPGWHTQLEIIDKFDEDYEKLRNYTKSEKKST